MIGTETAFWYEKEVYVFSRKSSLLFYFSGLTPCGKRLPGRNQKVRPHIQFRGPQQLGIANQSTNLSAH